MSAPAIDEVSRGLEEIALGSPDKSSLLPPVLTPPACGCAELVRNDSFGALPTPLHRCKGRHHLPIIGEEMQGDQVHDRKPGEYKAGEVKGQDRLGLNPDESGLFEDMLGKTLLDVKDSQELTIPEEPAPVLLVPELPTPIEQLVDKAAPASFYINSEDEPSVNPKATSPVQVLARDPETQTEESGCSHEPKETASQARDVTRTESSDENMNEVIENQATSEDHVTSSEDHVTSIGEELTQVGEALADHAPQVGAVPPDHALSQEATNPERQPSPESGRATSSSVKSLPEQAMAQSVSVTTHEAKSQELRYSTSQTLLVFTASEELSASPGQAAADQTLQATRNQPDPVDQASGENQLSVASPHSDSQVAQPEQDSEYSDDRGAEGEVVSCRGVPEQFAFGQATDSPDGAANSDSTMEK